MKYLKFKTSSNKKEPSQNTSDKIEKSQNQQENPAEGNS
jgi:hypothetical protein